jgi:hypothetical protein
MPLRHQDAALSSSLAPRRVSFLVEAHHTVQMGLATLCSSEGIVLTIKKELFPTFRHRTFSEWHFLGAPIGARPFVDSFVASALDRAMVKMRQLLKLPCHIAFALLKHCLSLGVAQFFMRMVGPCDAFGPFDDAVLTCFSHIASPVDGELDLIQLRLPCRRSGFGLRSAHATAPLAFIASSSAAASVRLSTHFADLPEDPLIEDAVSSVPLTHMQLQADLLAFARSGTARFGDHAQRKFADEFDKVELERLVAACDLRGRARISSSSASGASGFLSPMFVAHSYKNMWLSDFEFTVACKRRLGHPIFSAPKPCSLCSGRQVCDVLGDHAYTCMAKGERIRFHSTMADVLHRHASSALLLSRREASPFPENPGLRVDWLMLRSVPPRACDFAFTSATQSSASMASAAAAPGGWATQYEGVKQRTYGHLCKQQGLQLTPVILDSFMAWGDSARPLFTEISKHQSHRFGLPAVVSLQLLLQDVHLTALRGLARLAALNTDPIPGNRSPMNAPEAPGCRVEL